MSIKSRIFFYRRLVFKSYFIVFWLQDKDKIQYAQIFFGKFIALARRQKPSFMPSRGTNCPFCGGESPKTRGRIFLTFSAVFRPLRHCEEHPYWCFMNSLSRVIYLWRRLGGGSHKCATPPRIRAKSPLSFPLPPKMHIYFLLSFHTPASCNNHTIYNISFTKSLSTHRLKPQDRHFVQSLFFTVAIFYFV